MLAEALDPGDVIGIVAPSAPVDPGQEAFHQGIKFLSEMGFGIDIGRHVFSKSQGYTASPEERGEDINFMFSEPGVKAIVCAQGGHTANSCLPFIDWDIVKANPKIFVGMSDITVLCNAIYGRTGLVTFHGCDLMWGFGLEPDDYESREFNKTLIKGEARKVTPNGTRRCLNRGEGEGPLLGGNPGCLLKLAGTPYFPDMRGGILFLEFFENAPQDVDYMLTQLKQMGVLEQLNGLIIGHIYNSDNTENMEEKIINVVMRLLEEYNIPVLKVEDFGHCCPNTFLPVGAKVRLNSISREIFYLEKFIES